VVPWSRGHRAFFWNFIERVRLVVHVVLPIGVDRTTVVSGRGHVRVRREGSTGWAHLFLSSDWQL
jgi:hypothetical protein